MAFDRRETAILVIGDFIILAASLWVALFLRNLELPDWGYLRQNIVPFLPMFLIFLTTFFGAGLYEKQTRPVRGRMGLRVLGAQIANAIVAAVLFFALPLTIEPKTILVLFVAVSVVSLAVWRFYRMHQEMKMSERAPAVMVGRGQAVDELYEEINGNGKYRIRFVAKIDVYDPARVPKEVLVVVGDTYDSSVIATLPLFYTNRGGRVLFEFSGLYEEVFDRVPLAHTGIETVIDSLSHSHRVYDVIKRLFDLVLALLLSLIALPFILFGALGRVLTGTPVFFLHTRIGRSGKPFTMIKLGSMLLNDHGDPELQKKNRVTGFGKFLRKTRIDELPQLWNVLKGELSFIGPRPELPKIAEVYEREIPFYPLRHLVTPGLSGWAQIHDYDAPRGAADVERTKKKLSFDLYYLKHRSLGLDLAIAIKTIRALLAFSGV